MWCLQALRISTSATEEKKKLHSLKLFEIK
jgi:hypothetical protein